MQKIKAQFPEPHTTLFPSIQISVNALDATSKEIYISLAVMPEEMAVAPEVQQCLWGVDESEATETAEQFVGLSQAKRDQREGSISLHDLQLDYIRAHYPEKEALELINRAVRLSSNGIAEETPAVVSRHAGR